MRIETDGSKARAVARLSRGVGRVSRLWNQKGLGTMYLWLGRVPALQGQLATVEFERDCRFELDPLEPYWAPTIMGGRRYEPELRHVLTRLASVRPTFIDCGANFGYWSVVATGVLGLDHVLSIEASPSTFRRLERQWTLNGERFRPLFRAVADTTGQTVYLEDAEHHAAAHVSATGTSGIAVSTTRIDDAVREAGFDKDRSFLVKLDVEGHELPAFAGAGALRDRDTVFVYEDWSKPGWKTSKALLADGFRLYYPRKSGELRVIRSVDDATRAAIDDQKLERSQNLVAARGTGPLTELVDRWANRG